MEITINLASRPFIDLRPILKIIRRCMAGLAAGIIALGFAANFVHQWAVRSHREVSSLEVQIKRATAELQGYQKIMQQPENLKLSQQAEELNQLFDAKAFSWTVVMRDLETALPAGVQVTAIDPTRANDGKVTLHMRVHGPRNKGVELVRNLEHSKYFRLPRIVGESADTMAAAGEKLEPVSISNSTEFDLLAEYNVDLFDDSGFAKADAGTNQAASAGFQPELDQEKNADAHRGILNPPAAFHKRGPK
jgi:type IV pilus assembly protein PilN